METRTVRRTLEEDLKKIGLTDVDVKKQLHLGGVVTESDDSKSKKCEGKDCEKSDEDNSCPECGTEMEDGVCPECGYEVEYDDEMDDTEESRRHPLDSKVVNESMFDAIMDLPFENLEAEDIDAVLNGLKMKVLPNRAHESLKNRASEVVDFLVSEAVAKRTRKAKAGSMAKKAVFQCPPGTRKDPNDPNGRRCIRAAKAAGGAGKLAKQSRKKAKWMKSGAGKVSSRKSARWAARRGESDESLFALELKGLMEDVQSQNESVRDELLDHIGNIIELLSEEFNDEAVTRVFEDACESLDSSWEAGRLDEDVMDEDEFIAEIKPVLTLIHKSLDRIQGNGGLGN